MTALDLTRLKALAQAATPGPWHWVNSETDQPRKRGEWRASLRTVQEYPTRHVGALPKFIVNADEICDERMDANADFIAAANPAAVLHLLALHDDRVREVLELYDRLRNVEAESARQFAERDSEIKRLREQMVQASWALYPDRNGS